MTKIAIVNSSSFGKYFPSHIQRLEAIGQVDRFTFPIDTTGKELAEKLAGYEYIIASVTPFFKKDFFEHAGPVKLISRHGIGFNNVDIVTATQYNTFVSKVGAMVEQEAVAENAIALLMSVLRQVNPAAAAAKAGRWADRANFMGYEIKGKTVGVIGLGNIGSRVGEILKNGFNAELIAYDPYQTAEAIQAKGAVSVSLEELLKRSDIISLNAFVDKNSYHLLGKDQFAMMKKGVYITNTARGELMNLEALLESLDNGTVLGLGADVVEGEPIDETHPLLKYPNVVITPHTSAYTYECLEGMGEKCVSDVERVHQGLAPEGLVNTDILSK